MKTFSFLHLSDLHFDAPFQNVAYLPPSLREVLVKSSVSSFHQAAKIAVEREIDFILIAGDLFDSSINQIETQIEITKIFETLINNKISSYICLGNHDANQLSWLMSSEYLKIFSTSKLEEVIHKNKSGAAVARIIGTSFSGSDNLFIKKGLSEIEKSSLPTIAVLHSDISSMASPYNSFSVEELKSYNLDYVALGHIHQHQVIHKISPYIVYSGTIQGRSLKPSECGKKGGICVNFISGSTFKLEFIETADVLFEHITLDLQEANNIPELFKLFTERTGSKFQANKHVIARITIKYDSSKINELQNFGAEEALLTNLRNLSQENNIFIESILAIPEKKPSGVIYQRILDTIQIEADQLKLDHEAIRNILSDELKMKQLDHQIDTNELVDFAKERITTLLS